MEIKGLSVVAGIAIGNIHILKNDFDEEILNYINDGSEKEKAKYDDAVLTATAQVKKILKTAKETDNKTQVAIMEAHLLMLSDPMLEANSYQLIDEGLSAPEAVLNASNQIAEVLGALEDAYLRERAADVIDIGRRIIRILLNLKEPAVEGENMIICGDDIEPSMIANLSTKQVAGVVFGNGSSTSHAVIIAKAKGFVTLVGIGEAINSIKDKSQVILDAYEEKLILEPTKEILDSYQKKLEIENQKKAYYLSLSSLPAVTKDGREIILAANIGNPKDIDDALQYGCKGVGLFRTEFVFLGKSKLPTEEEQYNEYKYVVQKAGNELCVIRTMDIGGDKPLEYLSIPEEDNPFLGYRAIRICLDKTDLFLTQIKAILRAGVFGKVAIMIPMIINIEEIKQAKELISQAMDELEKENKDYSKDVQIGIMIETPASAVMAMEFAKEVDFFSIGTNDLVQYTLAVDRGNQKIRYLYDHFNPAVIKLIYQIITAAHTHGKWVGMCGEMASDPLATALLLEMGLDEFSMSSPTIPIIKEIVQNLPTDCQILPTVLAFTHTSEVRDFLINYKSSLKLKFNN